MSLEKCALKAVRQFAEREVDIDTAIAPLARYDRHQTRVGSQSLQARLANYRRTLEDRPWEKCRCDVCVQIGVEVVLFRGANRNRRRGFHNLYVLYDRLQATRRGLL